MAIPGAAGATLGPVVGAATPGRGCHWLPMIFRIAKSNMKLMAYEFFLGILRKKSTSCNYEFFFHRSFSPDKNRYVYLSHLKSFFKIIKNTQQVTIKIYNIHKMKKVKHQNSH